MPPEGAKRFSAIGETAREALSEMRRLLGVLREDADPVPTRAPQPGLADVVDLVDGARAGSGGASTRLIVHGHVTPLEPGVELTAYRIVQEGLSHETRGIDRPEPRERCGSRPYDALGGTGEMRRGSEAEYPRDVADVVARVLRQLGGRDEADEVDDPFQVRRAFRRERATQVFARDPDRLGERVRAERPAGLRDHAAPRRVLHWLSDAERGWWFLKRIEEASGERRREHEVAQCVVVHAIDHDIRELEGRAASDGWAVGATHGREGEKREARELAGELRRAPRFIRGRPDVHQGRVHQRRAERGDEFRRGASHDEAGATARERGAGGRAYTLSGREDDDARWRGSHGNAERHARSGRERFGCHELVRAAQHIARVRVRDELHGVLVHFPPAGGDAFGSLR